MTREEILAEVEQEFGAIPGWIDGMPDAMLENFWNLMSWTYVDSLLSARDKNLVGFGVSAALHCEY